MRWSLWMGLIALVVLASAGFEEGVRAEEPSGADIRCLAMNVYWEARSGSPRDQLAVAYVTLNRLESEDFPDLICAVVHQGGEALHACQFSWWCDGKPDRPENAEAWQNAVEIARKAVAGIVDDPTGGALFFHNDSVYPDWADRKTRTAAFGGHVFYR